MKGGPIILIEDDTDDHEILKVIFEELSVKNQLTWFSNCNDAFNYLIHMTNQPFLIFCDVNLPGQSGLDFKKEIDKNKALREKSIPFIFYSTSVSQKSIHKAYTEMAVQGFFEKQSDYAAIKATIKIIVDYWMKCKHPHSG